MTVDLSVLPDTIVLCIAQFLDHSDIAQLAATSKAVKRRWYDSDIIWRQYCTEIYGKKIDVEQWCNWQDGEGQADTVGTLVDHGAQGNTSLLPVPCQNFRDLYAVLHKLSSLEGFWQQLEGGPQGGLFVCKFQPTCMLITRVKNRVRRSQTLVHEEVLRIDSRGPLVSIRTHSNGEFLQLTQPEHPATATKAAQTVADVAMGWSSRGSSPESTSALMEYLTTQVRHMGTSSSKRRSRKSRTSSTPRNGRYVQAFGSYAESGLHLRKLPTATPCRTHPLRGYWHGYYGDTHGQEVVLVNYHFGGDTAKIQATKVIGDPNVPAETLTWRVDARPEPQPDAASFLQAGIHVSILDLQDPQLGRGMLGSNLAQVESWMGPMIENGGLLVIHPDNVKHVYRGQGQVAQEGYVSPEWLPGRLIEYKNDCLSFVWMADAQQFCISYKRAEDALWDVDKQRLAGPGAWAAVAGEEL